MRRCHATHHVRRCRRWRRARGGCCSVVGALPRRIIRRSCGHRGGRYRRTASGLAPEDVTFKRRTPPTVALLPFVQYSQPHSARPHPHGHTRTHTRTSLIAVCAAVARKGWLQGYFSFCPSALLAEHCCLRRLTNVTRTVYLRRLQRRSGDRPWDQLAAPRDGREPVCPVAADA